MRTLKWIAIVLAGLFLVLAGVLTYAFQDRPDLAQVGPPFAPAYARGPGDHAVTATWLGVSTLLIDDGVTQIMVDGFISRPSLLDVLRRQPVAPDAQAVARAVQRFDLTRLAVIAPIHSHYDHAMDVGVLSQATGAPVLGSDSTLQIARGGGATEERLLRIAPGRAYPFGAFRLTALQTRHAPLGKDVGPGPLTAPLIPPQPVSVYPVGGAYLLLVEHPLGSILIQGSAGIGDGDLSSRRADVVFLGAGALERLGPAYGARYFAKHVTGVAAKRVFPVHYDDFVTQPFGTLRAPPRFAGRADVALTELAGLAKAAGVQFAQLPLGQPVLLFAGGGEP